MALRQKVGMLFQRPNPFPMSIGGNVVAGARAHKVADKAGLRTILEERLAEVGLWDAVKDRLKDSPFRLSGGQQQLLCLARALAISPDVLLLDEPTSALDPMATESIEALIRRLVPGLTVVIVTHNDRIARAACESPACTSASTPGAGGTGRSCAAGRRCWPASRRSCWATSATWPWWSAWAGSSAC